MKFDILFLCHEKDKDILKESLKYAKKNVLGYRKIFLLSKKNYFSRDKDIEFVNEGIFPFDKEEIARYAPLGRAGWYFQQFLKLYFFKVMGKKVLENLLIIDADTIFLKKTEFFENGKPLYNVEIGYHQPYYEILEKIFGFGRQSNDFSGITHHMIFQRRYIEDIFRIGSRNGKKEFWKEIMENINKETVSGFSEYDLYFNYMLTKHPDRIKIRKIRFIEFPNYNKEVINIAKFLGYYYLSAHDYLREKKFPILGCIFSEFLKRFGLKRFLKEILIKSKIINEK